MPNRYKVKFVVFVMLSLLLLGVASLAVHAQEGTEVRTKKIKANLLEGYRRLRLLRKSIILSESFYSSFFSSKTNSKLRWM